MLCILPIITLCSNSRPKGQNPLIRATSLYNELHNMTKLIAGIFLRLTTAVLGAKKYYYSLKVRETSSWAREVFTPLLFPAPTSFGESLILSGLDRYGRGRKALILSYSWAERQHTPLSCPLLGNTVNSIIHGNSMSPTHLVPLQPQVNMWLYV